MSGETNDAGDIDSEYDGLGVLGVVGSVRYAFVGFVGIDGGGVYWRRRLTRTKRGDGTCTRVGGNSGKRMSGHCCQFQDCLQNVGYGSGPAKSLRTISQKSLSAMLSQSRY